MSNTILNQVYNHYLTSYAPKKASPYNAHKRSELKGIYNSIVKLNKESPLYLPDTSSETKAFAVGVKDQALGLHSMISSLSGNENLALLNKKTAYSTNESIATAEVIGQSSDFSSSFDIEVQSMASSQVNLGAFLTNGKVALPPETYSFDVNINDLNYEFQFGIREDETNLDVQKRLERLINNSEIGIHASIIGDGNGRTSLKLASVSTGLPAGKSANFFINDNNTSKVSGTVDYFGLNYMAVEPKNAKFLINGEERSSTTNQFTVEKTYKITLTGTSLEKGQVSTIGQKTDLDSITDNIHSLVGSYNSFIKAANDYTQTLSRGQRLETEMKGLSSAFQNDLDSLGIRLQKDGAFTVDDQLLRQSVSEGVSDEWFAPVKEFATSLLRKSSQVSINPMEYVDKTMVSYKNPRRSFATPYITSAYSGMLFNSYC